MSHGYDDERLSDARDPLDARDQDFDWQGLYRQLSEDALDEHNDKRTSEAVVRLLALLLPRLSGRRIQPESIGLRLIALAWVLSPAYFDGSPSVARLAKRCGVRAAALANFTGYYSRLLRWRNRGQRHAWNWFRKGTPTHRGAGAKTKVKRNVPDSVEGTTSATRSPSQATASRPRETAGRRGGGVAPINTNDEREPAASN